MPVGTHTLIPVVGPDGALFMTEWPAADEEAAGAPGFPSAAAIPDGTRVWYRPDGKAGGSASAMRYATYSPAATVGAYRSLNAGRFKTLPTIVARSHLLPPPVGFACAARRYVPLIPWCLR